MEHHTEIQSLKDRVVILTAVIRYSDYNGCNTLPVSYTHLDVYKRQLTD